MQPLKKNQHVDSGIANKISFAFVLFFCANATINLIAIISRTPFDKQGLVWCILAALVFSLASSIPIILKKNKVITQVIIMIVIGMFKFMSSEDGDVSGMSLIITAVNYYIITNGVSYAFVLIVSFLSVAIVTYFTGVKMLGVTTIANSFLYMIFAFYIRHKIYNVPITKPREFTEDQYYIIQKIACGKVGKEIYPELGISLSSYNDLKKGLRDITGTETDGHLIAWAKDRKII